MNEGGEVRRGDWIVTEYTFHPIGISFCAYIAVKRIDEMVQIANSVPAGNGLEDNFQKMFDWFLSLALNTETNEILSKSILNSL